ncbi:MAG: zinc ribbon domain-containing protein [Lentisphaeraceae bacterium]|nr:zinc ribbon domain-containing protein [Lentisphaeraceae bacterium]
MPTYDYKCENCGHTFETLQTMSAEHLKTCPECKDDSLKRLIGAGAGLLFKGSGFYQTDYRSKSYNSDKKKDKKPAEKKKQS